MTPAGWVFGLTSTVGILALIGVFVALAEGPTPHLPRWAIKVFGPILLLPVTAYFIFGAKLMKRAGYPVFHEPKASKPAASPSGLPPRRNPSRPDGLPPRRPSRSE